MENFSKLVDPTKEFKPNVEWSPQCAAVFENSLILSEIFSHVESAKDLKNIRLVSRFWREMSIKQWRRVGTVQLLWTEDTTFCCDYCQFSTMSNQNKAEDHYGLGLHEYLKVLEISEQQGESCPYQLCTKPFSRYRIECCSFINRNQVHDKNLETFWNVCGAQIKYLNLDHVIIENATYYNFESIGGILFEKLPNLEELEMLILPVQRQFDPLDYDMPARQEGNNLAAVVCKPSSKLGSIIMGICKGADGEAVRQVSERLRKWLDCIPNIKSLKVDSKAAHYLEALLSPNIKLKNLTLPVQEGIILNSYDIVKKYISTSKPPLQSLKIGVDLMRSGRRASVRDFLRSCGQTLQHLELRSYPLAVRGKSLSGHLKNITFPHLTKLYLFGEAVISLRALKDIPNLQTRWIQADNCLFDWNQRIAVEAKEETREGKLLWREMTHLHIDYYRFTPHSLRVLGRWMPNLRRAQLFLHKSTSELVLQIWPQAETFSGLVGSSEG